MNVSSTKAKAFITNDVNIKRQIDFKYAAQFNEGMLQLQEMGVLAGLQKKWWKERKGGGACSVGLNFSIMFWFNFSVIIQYSIKIDDKTVVVDEAAVPLEMANIVGIFYVLITGTIFAIIYGIAGLMLQVYNLARKHKVCELLWLMLFPSKPKNKPFESSQNFPKFLVFQLSPL